MNSKELRKLGRRELLEILLEQTKRIEELESELEKVNNELNERKVSLKNIGSIAEASLVLGNIFKAADECVNVYKKNSLELFEKEKKEKQKELREFKKKKLEEIDKECKKRISNAEKEILKLQKVNQKEVKDKKKRKNIKNKKSLKE